jgi:hypothetical protein
MLIAACSCQLDHKYPSKPGYVKPIISSTFNSRGQVDLINMIAYPYGPYTWILHYQDIHDKMSYLCAMENKEADSRFKISNSLPTARSSPDTSVCQW